MNKLSQRDKNIIFLICLLGSVYIVISVFITIKRKDGHNLIGGTYDDYPVFLYENKYPIIKCIQSNKTGEYKIEYISCLDNKDSIEIIRVNRDEICNKIVISNLYWGDIRFNDTEILNKMIQESEKYKLTIK